MNHEWLSAAEPEPLFSATSAVKNRRERGERGERGEDSIKAA